MKTSEQSRRNLIALTVHIVWTTWKRQPYLVGERERRAYHCLSAEAEKLRVPILALNGLPDHVHLIVLLPSSVSLAKLMHQLKGSSSHLLNSEFPEEEHGVADAIEGHWHVVRISQVQNQTVIFNSCSSSSLGTLFSPKLCFAAARYLHGSHRNIGCAPGIHSCADE